MSSVGLAVPFLTSPSGQRAQKGLTQGGHLRGRG